MKKIEAYELPDGRIVKTYREARAIISNEISRRRNILAAHVSETILNSRGRNTYERNILLVEMMVSQCSSIQEIQTWIAALEITEYGSLDN